MLDVCGRLAARADHSSKLCRQEVSDRRHCPALHQPDQGKDVEGPEPSTPDLVVVPVTVADEFQEHLRRGHPAERQQLQGGQLGREHARGRRNGREEHAVQVGHQLRGDRVRMQGTERQLPEACEELVPGGRRTEGHDARRRARGDV